MATSKREKQAERQDIADSRATERDLEALLYPTKAAEGALRLEERDVLLKSAQDAAAEKKKALEEQTAKKGAFADAYNRENGANLTADQIEGVLAAQAATKQKKLDDPVFSAEQRLKVLNAQEDSDAMVAGGMDSKAWGALSPAQQNKARFEGQMSGLTPKDGTGLHWDELSKLPVGSGTVADALNDPNSFTARGRMKPNVEKNIQRAQEAAILDRTEKRRIAQAVALTEAQGNTPIGKALAAQKAATAAADKRTAIINQWTKRFGPELKHASEEERREHFNQYVISLGGEPGSAAPDPETSAVDSFFPNQPK